MPTVGQGLIFQTGSTDMSAPIRLLRKRRESHARFVALVTILVDAARWHHEILVRLAYIEIFQQNIPNYKFIFNYNCDCNFKSS